jgi:hypothetical protein
MLAMAKYACNNSKHSGTKTSPFYTNYGFKPQSNWPTEVQFSDRRFEVYAQYMTGIHSTLSEQLEQSNEAMRKYYNMKPKTIEPFRKGELVLVSGKNIRPKQRCKKLEDKMSRPFEVVGTGNNG